MLRGSALPKCQWRRPLLWGNGNICEIVNTVFGDPSLLMDLRMLNHSCFFVFTGYPVSVSGMITLPVSSSVYQSMVANIQQIHTNGDGTLCITPMQVQKSGQQCSTTSTNSNSINSSSIMSKSNVCSAIGNIGNTDGPNTNPMILNTSQLNAPTTLSNGSAASHHHQNNLLDLCRVLQQNTHNYNNNNNCHNTTNNIQFNHTQSNMAPNKNKPKKNLGQPQNITATNNLIMDTNFFDHNNHNDNNNNSNNPNHNNSYNQSQNQIINSNTINNNNINRSEEKYSHFLSQQSHHNQITSIGETQAIGGSDVKGVLIQMNADSHSIKMECDVDIL